MNLARDNKVTNMMIFLYITDAEQTPERVLNN